MRAFVYNQIDGYAVLLVGYAAVSQTIVGKIQFGFKCRKQRSNERLFGTDVSVVAALLAAFSLTVVLSLSTFAIVGSFSAIRALSV